MWGGRNKWGKAFSLVEVVMALGIVSFCLLSLVGLLPVGLDTIKKTNEQAAAVVCLNQIAESIRTAAVNESGDYQALGSYTNLTWQGQSVHYAMPNISLGGLPTNNALEQRLTAYVQITPAANASTKGTAWVTVAWPNQAQWNTTNNRWEKAQGSVSSWVVFYSNP